MSPRLTRAGLALVAILALQDGALAQYGSPPPYGYGYAPPRPVLRLGLNCATYTPASLFAPAMPFYCPLPQRQPLGSACVCRAPADYGRQDWEGRVVP